MDATERIEAIKNGAHYSSSRAEALITAICQYVAGEGSLQVVQQEWSILGSDTFFDFSRCIVISDPNAERLDEMDLRFLDISIMIDKVNVFFFKIAAAGPVEQARDYLRAKGINDSAIIETLLRTSWFQDNVGSPTALGRLMLSYIPEHFGEILKVFPSINVASYHRSLFKLLFTAQPEGYLHLAWQLANIASRYEKDQCAAELLKADPAQFTDWARQVARDTIQNRSSYTSHEALKALLELDPAQHIDLAVEAAQTPLSRFSATLQWIGTRAAYLFYPVKYQPLMEEALMAPDAALRGFTFNLLKEVDFEQARPMLQRCIASGEIEAAAPALDALLKYEWPERQDYLISLLSHRFKWIRDTSAGGLAKAGESVIEALAPSLAHKNADTRLAAVHALRRIGGEQARGVLVARLDIEKSLKVKWEILDVVGVAAAIATSEAAPASPAEALIAEAEAVLKRLKKPALPWFDAAQMQEVVWKEGGPVPPVVVNYLLHLQSHVKLMEPAERVQQALSLIDRGSSGDLALALFNGWLGQDAPSKQGWCLPLACALADERLIPLLRQAIDGWAGRLRGVMAEKAVAAMASIESDLALEEINDLRKYGFHRPAQRALEAAAKRRGLTLEDIYDQVVSKLGFDEHGLLVFDYGPRQFTLRLHFDQSIQITDNDGKRFMKLPNPGKRDDERKARAAQATWNVLRKWVSEVVKTQAGRLEEALKSRRSWEIARWQTLFLKHPVLRSLAVTLVWGVVADESSGYPSGYQYIFRPLEDGSLTDVEDNAVELPAEGQIRLVDPTELDEELRNAWLQHLTDYEVMQPFAQLNRSAILVQR